MIVLKRKVKRCESLESVYRKISNILEKENIVENSEILINSFLERQNMGPVQITSDFYLPHIRTKEVSDFTVINVDGFKDNKVLFLLVPDENFEKYKEMAIKIIMKLDNSEFMENMSYSEELFREYIISVVTEENV